MDGFLAAELTTLEGQTLRFGPDEADVGDIPKSIEWDTQSPGGDHTGSCVLARPPQMRADDAKLFRRVRIYGPGGATAYVGRVQGVPQVGAAEIRLELEGLAASLDDDETFREVYIDRDPGRWGEPSLARRSVVLGAGWTINHYSASTEGGGLTFDGEAESQIPSNAVAEVAYDAGDAPRIAALLYRGTQQNTTSVEAATLYASDEDDFDPSFDSTALTLDDSSRSATVAARRHALLRARATATHTPAAGAAFARTFSELAVVGNHGLALSGEAPRQGFYASDVVGDVLARQASEIEIGPDSIEQGGFVIPHLVFSESTTARAVIEAVSAFGTAAGMLPDWGVYEGEFYWRSAGSYGHVWRIRRDQVANPVSAGPDAARRCRAVLVSYQDTSGHTFTVGPPGSGADTESALLEDSDPTNPSPRVRHQDVGLTFEEGALWLGQLLLAESNRIRWRGSVEIQGEATDEAGNVYPARAVRAGDHLYIEDEDEPELMPVGQTSYSHDSITCQATIAVDPNRLDVVLSQLAAASQFLYSGG